MKLSERLYVYKGQFGYSTLLKNNEDKMYVSVQFKKGQEPVNERTQIDIKDGFVSFYKDKNGFAKPKFVILDYTELETLQNNQQQNDYIPPMNDSELPF